QVAPQSDACSSSVSEDSFPEPIAHPVVFAVGPAFLPSFYLRLSYNILSLSRLEYLRQGKGAGIKIIGRLLCPQKVIILTSEPCLIKKEKKERGGRHEDNRL
ncbi:MAG: hypothetical protein QW734_11580, partial [Candidatus Bathyarchaeia archaeon]